MSGEQFQSRDGTVLQESIEDVRERIVNRILVIMSVVGFAGILFSIPRHLEFGFRNIQHIIHFGYLILLIATLARNRMSLRSKSLILLSLSFLLGAASLVGWGMVSMYAIYFMATIFIASLLFDFMASLLILGASLLTMGAVAVLAHGGMISFDIDYDRFLQAPTTWLLAIANIGVFAFPVLVGFNQLHHSLAESNHLLAVRSEELTRLNLRLQKEIRNSEKAEEMARQSEKQYRFLADNATDLIWTMDVNHLGFTYASPQVLALREITVEEALALKLEETMPPSSLEVALRVLRQELDLWQKGLGQEGSIRTVELELYRKDRGTVWTETRIRFLADDTGRPTTILGVTRDISERKKAEEALRVSEERSRLIAENAKVVIWMMDLNLRYTYISPYIRKSVGYSPDEFMAKPLQEVLTPASIELCMRCLVDELEEEKNPLRDLARSRTVEVEHIHRDGRIIPAEIDMTFIRDASGKAVGILGITRDITERKKTDEQMLRLSVAMERAGEGVMITDPEGLIQYVNPAFERITGYSRGETLGRNPRMVKSGVHDAEFYRNLWSTISGGKVWSGRITNRRKDGQLVQVDATISPILLSSGELIGYVSLKRDATEILMLEEQLRQSQKMEAIGTLAGGIAHDFNNILGGILGYTELSLMHHIPPENPARKYLEEVMNAGNRAKDLVAQIMTFSRRTEQKRQPMETGCIVKESLKLLRASLPSTIDIRTHIDPVAGVILADPTQIHQVIINLCTNAYQALKEKGGIIDVSLVKVVFGAGRAAPHPDLKHDVEYQELTVRDTGHGIDPAIIHRIFDPFFTTKKTGEGSGLGLAVVYGIVQGHGGAVTVESMPGQGTTFRLYIPTINRQRIDMYEQKQALFRGTERIVFVDDEASLTYIYRVQLENLGYGVRDFNDPLEALAGFRNEEMECDLVITDRSMPHMDGMELAHAIIGIRPDLPIILCTGAIEAMDQVLLEKSGIRKVLTKPMTIEVMAQAIRQILEKR